MTVLMQRPVMVAIPKSKPLAVVILRRAATAALQLIVPIVNMSQANKSKDTITEVGVVDLTEVAAMVHLLLGIIQEDYDLPSLVLCHVSDDILHLSHFVDGHPWGTCDIQEACI